MYRHDMSEMSSFNMCKTCDEGNFACPEFGQREAADLDLLLLPDGDVWNA